MQQHMKHHGDRPKHTIQEIRIANCDEPETKREKTKKNSKFFTNTYKLSYSFINVTL